MKRLGLIINPVAGLGGRTGLKGSDGLAVQQRARALGAIPESGERTELALQSLRSALEKAGEEIEILTPPGEMGAQAAQNRGFSPLVMGEIEAGATTAEDTRRAARGMLASDVDLLLFAGGDGTARDIISAVGQDLPVLGIPAGVKIHSAVFAISPIAAGELAAGYLLGKTGRLREAEVVDLDEQDYRDGLISTRLYGYLRVPYRRLLVQNQKVPSPKAESAQLQAIAAAVVEVMQPDRLYILGPGTTTRAVAGYLGYPKTLVGVDVLTTKGVIALDVYGAQLEALVKGKAASIIVSPIGGQGFLFGRGNQPITPFVIRQAGRDNILVVCLPQKLNGLSGRPLMVDTGDTDLDAALNGHIRVITGYHEFSIYRVRTKIFACP